MATLLPAAAALHVSTPSIAWAQAGAPTCLGKPATHEASSRDRLVVGTPRADVIVGSRKADRIRGRGGNDLICGRAGGDRLAGESGDDRLAGGKGRDRCDGGSGANTYAGCEVRPNEPPTAGRLAVSTTEDEPIAIDVLAKASDPDSDPLIVDLVSGGSGGEVRILDARLVRFDPARRFDHLGANQSATVAFGFRVGDGRGGSAQGVVDVTVEGRDDPPAAANDTKVLTGGSGADFVDVLANDTDVDGGPKAVVSVSQPAHGKVTIAEGGAGLTYEPEAGYCNDAEAPDTFTYSLNGGSVATVTARVVCVTTFSADPPLTPSFDPDVSDYTVRCTGDPVEVSGRTAEGATVSVDGGQPTGGKFAAAVPLEENQAFGFTTTVGGVSRNYFVRCLPPSFPAWDYEQLQQPSHELYVVTPNLIAPAAQYVVVFNRDGVPVWWSNEPGGTLQDAKVLPDGTLAWWNANTGYVIREPDGTLVRQVSAVGFTDGHELQQLPNGNFLLISNEIGEGVDLTEYGGTADEDVEHMVVQEVSPAGALVWSWSTKGHIGLAETGRWWPTALATQGPRDIVHMNAIEPVGESAVLISNRHNDAIYKIDKATGEIVWKLGGTWTPKSLRVLGDPEGAYPFGGQHDMRLQPDGTITVYDNNTNFAVPPRAVRYAIDEVNRTATLVEQVTDPLAPNSFCCGSARRSADGSWLLSWGGSSFVAEYDDAGQPKFRLDFGDLFSYRAVPVDDGALSASSLRAGMDAMHPR